MPEQQITSDQFWNLYFSKKITHLSRKQDRYCGTYDDYTANFPTAKDFFISHEELSKHIYAKDKRFLPIHDDVRDSLLAILNLPDVEQGTLANQQQLNLVCDICEIVFPFANYQSQLVYLRNNIHKTDVKLKSIIDTLINNAPTIKDYQNYQETRKISYLHRERILLLKVLAITNSENSIVADAICQIINNSYEDIDTKNFAIWALARRNEKQAIPKLLEWLQNLEYKRFHHALEQALQFICSGSELIPLAHIHDNSYKSNDKVYQYWNQCVEKNTAWDELDSSSVFYEKRLALCAITTCQNLLEKLASDEINIISSLAKERLQQQESSDNVVTEEITEYTLWLDMLCTTQPETDIDNFLHVRDEVPSGQVYKPGGPGILGCGKRVNVPGHFEITRKVMKELKDNEGNALLTSNVINSLSRAARIPDLIYFEDLRYHAQSTVDDKTYIPTDIEGDKRKYQQLLHEQIATTKTAANEGDWQKFLFHLGISIHMAQDLPAHQGMTNPEHAFLDHKQMSPDNSKKRCDLGYEVTRFFIEEFFRETLQQVASGLNKFQPGHWAEYETIANYLKLAKGGIRFLRKRLNVNEDKYQARWFRWNERNSIDKALAEMKVILRQEK